MSYDTGNPVGSMDPRDLYDNAENLDKLVNGDQPFYPDRLGNLRISLSGMQAQFTAAEAGRAADFDAFLTASGFSWLGDYGAGLTFTSRSQYTVRDGYAYRLSDSVTLPYTTTGNWAVEVANFQAFSADDVLRQDLADQGDADKGSALIGHEPTGETVSEALTRIDSDLQQLEEEIANIPAQLLDTLRIDVSAAATINLTADAPNTRHINIVGSGVTIAGFTVAAGLCYFARFDGSGTLANSANLVTQRGANLSYNAGTTCVIRATANNQVEILFFVLGSVDQMLHVRDVKASGTDGGTFTSGAWRTRDLNTVLTNSIPGASLTANQITLPAGTYDVTALAPHYQNGSSNATIARARLYSITSDVQLATGPHTRLNGSNAAGQPHSPVIGRFTLTASSVIELQHYTGQTKNTDGFGAAFGMGESEIYSDVIIRRID